MGNNIYISNNPILVCIITHFCAVGNESKYSTDKKSFKNPKKSNPYKIHAQNTLTNQS